MKALSTLNGIYLILISFFLITTLSKASSISESMVDPFEYYGKLSFLDGTPVSSFGDSEIDQFEIVNVELNHTYAAAVRKFTGDTMHMTVIAAGDYIMKFMGQEIVRFKVTDTDGKLNSSLSGSLSLPFNYIISGEPGEIIRIYNDQLSLLETIYIDETGSAGIKFSHNDFKNKFMAYERNGQFIEPFIFSKIIPEKKGQLRYHKFTTGRQTISAKIGTVHNLDEDTYYTIQKANFSDLLNFVWVLKVYDARNKKADLKRIQYPDNDDKAGSLYLNDKGQMVVQHGEKQYYLSNDGSLQEGKNIFVSPIYQFKNFYTKSNYWITPVFAGVALPEGTHTFTVNCECRWNDPNPTYTSWHEKRWELEKRGREAKSEEERKSIGEAIRAMGEEPTPASFPRSGTESSSETFQVVFDPDHDYLWRMYSPLDKDDFNEPKFIERCAKVNPAWLAHKKKTDQINQNSGLSPADKSSAIQALGQWPQPPCLEFKTEKLENTSYYYPSGIDPVSRLSEVEIRECTITLPGGGILGYSYVDEYACKGIAFSDWDSEEQRAAAAKSCQDNATRYIGFGYEGNAWGHSMNLFSSDQRPRGPINIYEGPYPELRYELDTLIGEYASRQEALKHCEKPTSSKGKFRCYETVIIKVCPDNYRYTVDGKVKTDYDALHCGETEPLESNDKGDEIVVIFSKEGYVTETRALSKRTLEAANILLSGHITDKNGVEIKGAHIKLRHLDGAAESDEAGIYNLITKASGTESYSEVMDIKLQKIGIDISNDELGDYKVDKPFGLVSDGFTTLKLKVKAHGIRPQTVIVKQPTLGNFVEQSMLKLPLILDANGEGEMEYVPPTYLSTEELLKRFKLKAETANKYGLRSHLWAAEIPFEFSYEDEEGNPGTYSINVLVFRPPVFLIHGFTGNEETWADLGNNLRGRKFEPIIREYYKGPADESTIERQSQKLGQYIQEIQKAYRENGILQNRIDIVAHSMGGLISRHYISNMSKYGTKAGIVIPYNVKLSREELAAARNQSPVKLIDIRKLIMVGTPNHGATWIDGRIGHLGAYLNDVHEVANSQLRSNSQFLANLNSGENEGRHLDPNVQYALLYGRRRIRSYYPPDNMKYKYTDPEALVKNYVTDDDGVVKVSSAKLNGVIDFAFPERRDNPVGFIHSPALDPPFIGDNSITIDIEIFDKVNELLLDDIIRVPLKNSFAKVYGSEGDASIRYYSSEAWKPISPGTSKKLESYWCQLKTEEGRTHIAFFLNNHHWGSIHIEPNTILRIENASPELVEVYLKQGKARFTSRKEEGGGFEIAMGDETEKWYNFNPKAVVMDINTDFIIDKDESIKVHSIMGEVSIGVSDKDIQNMRGKKIEEKGGIELKPTNEMIDSPLPDSGWWSTIDTNYLPDVSVSDSSENLIVNGSFEEGPDIGGYLTLRADATLPGWRIVKETVDLTGSYFKASDGDRSIDLIGTPGLGAIEQTIKTYPGGNYVLTFDLAGNPAGGPPIKVMQVYAAGQSRAFEFDITGKSIQNMGWEKKTWTFTASAEETILGFEALTGTNSSNYGAAIDNVVVYEQKDLLPLLPEVPIQSLGEIDLRITDDYLPIAGFTTLLIQAKDDQGKVLTSPYEVVISLAGKELLPFINIANTSKIIDESGKYETNITISEPNPEDFKTLDQIPLKVTFIVELLHPKSKEVKFENKLTIPLGMTLLKGQTIGPDYKPRQQPVAPEFSGTSYQMANQTDEKGNFYILFNTTLFNKDIEKFKALAVRTQQLFSMDQFGFSIEWSNTSSIPLKYELSDSLKKLLVPGSRIFLGKNGFIDLLSPEEQEQRIKRTIIRFIEGMPLETEFKSYVLNKLNLLQFTYGLLAANDQVYFDSENNAILIPLAKEDYWSHQSTAFENEPQLALIMHAMGHFLHHTIVLSDRTPYKFLEKACGGSEHIWTHQIDESKFLIDKSEHISFNEAGADFFNYLIFQFIKSNDHDFADKSIYFESGYLIQFEQKDLVESTLKKYPTYSVSGPQTSYLINYYGTECQNRPQEVYADFLYQQVSFSQLTGGGDPASTINEWLLVKQHSLTAEESLTSDTSYPIALAKEYGLMAETKKIALVPIRQFSKGSAQINDNFISDFEQIPIIYLSDQTHLNIETGRFHIMYVLNDKIQMIALAEKSSLYINQVYQMDPLLGTFYFKAPIAVQTSLARIEPESSDFVAVFEPESIDIYVFKGIVNIRSVKDEKIVSAGQFSSINKKGKMKKPKSIKEAPAPLQEINVVNPFVPNFEFDHHL